MDPKTKEFLEFLSKYAVNARQVEVAASQLTPELRELLAVREGVWGMFHGVQIKVVPSFRVVPRAEEEL